MMKRLFLALAFVAALSAAAFAVPQAAPSAMAFAFQAFLALGGTTAVNLAVRFGWQLTPYDFGAVGDGVADDTNSVQLWLTALATGGAEGFCPPGKYQLTTSVNGFSATNFYHMRGAGDACDFYVNFNGWGKAAIDLTNPTNPTGANRGVRTEWDHFKINYNSTLTAPPIAFRDRYATGLVLHDFSFPEWTVNRGTVLSLSGSWNLEHVRDGELWGGGARIAQHLVPPGTTFSITAGTNTLTSNNSFFTSADTGVTYYCLLAGTYSEVFTVTYVNPTTATTNRNAFTTHTNANCSSGGITGSMTSGSNVLTLSANNVPASFAGRTVYVEAAGGGSISGQLPFLRATIGTVTPGAPETLTLVNLDGSAVNAAQTVSNAVLIFDPVVELYSDVGGGAGLTNDVYLDNIHIEDFAGTALVASGCGADCTVMRPKFAANYFANGSTFGQTAYDSEFDAVISNSDLHLMEFVAEQANVGFTQILVEGQTSPIAIGNSTGLLTAGQYHVAMKNSAYGSFTTVGLANSGGRFDLNGACRSLYYSDGSSQYGIASQNGNGGYNSAGCLPTGNYGSIYPNLVFMGVSSALNFGDDLAIAYFNAYVAASLKSSMSIGQTCYNLGTDLSNQVLYECTVGSTGTAYNGASSSNIFGKYGLWLTGGTAAGTGLSSDTSGNFTEHGVFGLTAASWADNQTCAPGQISVDASYLYVCTAANTVKRVALSVF